jgi:LPS sulfotransferase NodH
MYNYYLHLHTYLIIRRKQILNVLSFKKSTDYVRFAILCEPRSGSTLLHTYLNFHPCIKSYGEVLREKRERSNLKVPDPIKSFVFKPHASHLKAIGLKLFYSYHNHPAYGYAFGQVVNDPDVKIIHLIRRNVLGLYVSLKIAQRTNLWSSITTSGSFQQIKVDADDFREFARAYLQQQRDLAKLLQNHHVLNVCYEDLIKDTDYVLKTVQEFLGVHPRNLLSLLKKQNPRPIESLVINYQDVKLIADQVLQSLKPEHETP